MIKNDKAIKEVEKAFNKELENDKRALELTEKTWHRMLVDGTDLETVIKVEKIVNTLIKSISSNDKNANKAIELLLK